MSQTTVSKDVENNSRAPGRPTAHSRSTRSVANATAGRESEHSPPAAAKVLPTDTNTKGAKRPEVFLLGRKKRTATAIVENSSEQPSIPVTTTRATPQAKRREMQPTPAPPRPISAATDKLSQDSILSNVPATLGAVPEVAGPQRSSPSEPQLKAILKHSQAMRRIATSNEDVCSALAASTEAEIVRNSTEQDVYEYQMRTLKSKEKELEAWATSIEHQEQSIAAQKQHLKRQMRSVEDEQKYLEAKATSIKAQKASIDAAVALREAFQLGIEQTVAVSRELARDARELLHRPSNDQGAVDSPIDRRSIAHNKKRGPPSSPTGNLHLNKKSKTQSSSFVHDSPGRATDNPKSILLGGYRGKDLGFDWPAEYQVARASVNRGNDNAKIEKSQRIRKGWRFQQRDDAGGNEDEAVGKQARDEELASDSDERGD